MNTPRQVTPNELEIALDEVEKAQTSLRALRSRMHEHGQTHWTGVLPNGEHTNDTPNAVFAEAHRLWRLASLALERSSHILAMVMVGAEPAPIQDELKEKST